MNNEIIFSKEEQDEILSQINSIAEKNRKAISQNAAPESHKIDAKKNGAVFPLIVNIAAIALLLGGAYLLFFFNSKIEAQVKTGTAVFNVTERALIDEIRKDTAEALAAKEAEISSIASRLSQVDDELFNLISSNQTLTSEQRAAQERLLAMQNAYREELSLLQNERTDIIEIARSREARLRAQMDERTREFAVMQQRTTSELDAARRDLEALTIERERLAAIEALFAGGVAVINDQGEVEQADSSEIIARNIELQTRMEEMQKTIDALSSGGSGQTRRITELQSQITALEHTAGEKDSRITLLETENNSSGSTISQLRNANERQEQEIANLRNQLTVIRQALQED